MRKYARIKTLNVVMLIAASGSVFAADSTDSTGGEISFHGSVMETTCEFGLEGNRNFTVFMHTVSLDKIARTAGVDSEFTEFRMKVICNNTIPTYGGFWLSSEFTWLPNATSVDDIYMANQGGSATGIGTSLQWRADISYTVKPGVVAGSVDDEGRLVMRAHYFNYGGTTPGTTSAGTVLGSFTYTLSYD